MAETETYICLYAGSPEECQNCGGWTKAGQEMGERGPFEPDPRFCSEDCYAEAQEFAQRAKREAESDWCPTCGFDRHEHADDCALSGAASCTPNVPLRAESD